MDHERGFRVGDVVTFRDRGVSREGRIVAVEQVGQRDRRGRSPGRWFTIRLSGSLFEDAEAPEHALGGIHAEVAR